MARSRMVKPEFSDDEMLATACSRDARLTYILSWCHTDDYGVLKAHPVWLKHHIFPYDDIPLDEFKKWLKEIEDFKRYIPFEANGERYYYLPKFPVHQKIKNPSTVRRNPAAPKEIIEVYGSPTEALPLEGGSPTEGGETEREVEVEVKEKVSKEEVNARAREDEEKTFPHLNSNGTKTTTAETVTRESIIESIKDLRRLPLTEPITAQIDEKIRRYGITEEELKDTRAGP